jgi:hypothetical protein
MGARLDAPAEIDPRAIRKLKMLSTLFFFTETRESRR